MRIVYNADSPSFGDDFKSAFCRFDGAEGLE